MSPLVSRIPPRLRSGWTLVGLIALIVLISWLPDLDLPFGDSDDGRILGRFGLQARNFYEDPSGSGLGASMAPYGGLYAHHPPLQNFLHIGAVGVFGEGVVAHRVIGFALGAATVVFLAAALRARGVAWGPVLLAGSVTASTGYYFVYMRQGGGFSFLLASTAIALYLAERDDPPRWMLVSAAGLAMLTAMHSWLSIAVLGMLVIWMLAVHRRRPATYWIAGGALLGLVLTVAWMLNATDVDALTNQFDVRSDTVEFSFSEFVSRQWRFAGRLTAGWYRWLIVPALGFGLWDRRTRLPVALTLGTAAAWTFAFQQGAWIHLLWNLPWLAPIGLGAAAFFDWIRRRIPATAGIALGVLLALVSLVTLYGAADGRIRNTFIANPANAGALLELYEPLPETVRLYVARGIPTPRWASYYWDLPLTVMEERHLELVGDDDFVLANVQRIPEYLPEDLADRAVDQIGRYVLVRGDALTQP